MADVLLRRLGPQHLVFPIGPLEFEALAAYHLQMWITPEDGFDAMHAGVMRSIPADEAIGGQLDRHIADADFLAGAIREQSIVPLGRDIDAFNKTAEKYGVDLNKAVNTTPVSAPQANLQDPTKCPPGTVPNPVWKITGTKYCVPPRRG